MAAASNAQVQTYVDERYRPRSETLRGFREMYLNDKAANGPIYGNLASTTTPPTWLDARTDVPQNLTGADVLALNAMLTAIEAAVIANGGAALIEKFCVRPLQVTFQTQ